MAAGQFGTRVGTFEALAGIGEDVVAEDAEIGAGAIEGVADAAEDADTAAVVVACVQVEDRAAADTAADVAVVLVTAPMDAAGRDEAHAHVPAAAALPAGMARGPNR